MPNTAHQAHSLMSDGSAHAISGERSTILLIVGVYDRSAVTHPPWSFPCRVARGNILLEIPRLKHFTTFATHARHHVPKG
jgi:hypothetical protein